MIKIIVQKINVSRETLTKRQFAVFLLIKLYVSRETLEKIKKIILDFKT